jgi:hypothetical protein
MAGIFVGGKATRLKEARKQKEGKGSEGLGLYIPSKGIPPSPYFFPPSSTS